MWSRSRCWPIIQYKANQVRGAWKLHCSAVEQGISYSTIYLQKWCNEVIDSAVSYNISSRHSAQKLKVPCCSLSLHLSILFSNSEHRYRSRPPSLDLASSCVAEAGSLPARTWLDGWRSKALRLSVCLFNQCSFLPCAIVRVRPSFRVPPAISIRLLAIQLHHSGASAPHTVVTFKSTSAQLLQEYS